MSGGTSGGTTSTSTSRATNRVSPWFVALLGAMTALGAISTDTYLPSLPEVAADLGTSAAAVQLTISGVLVGGALGQLLVGPLSDRFGRRRPVFFGIALHVVMSILCMLASSIGALIALRVLQGIGNASATVVAMAVIRDRFEGADAARVMSRLMLVVGVAPLFAPSLGGLIAGVAGWRAVFAFLALFGVVLAVVVHRWLPETLPVERRRGPGLGPALAGYRTLLRDRHFLALAVLPGLAMGALMSYVVGAPFVLRQGYGLSANQFALLFALNGAGLVLGAQVNAWLVRRVAPIRILRVALPTSVAFGLALLTMAVTGRGGLIGLLVPLWFMISINNFVRSNSSALALTLHGEIAGTAAALIGAMQAGIAGLVSPMVGLVGEDATAMATVMVASVTAGLVILALATPAYRRGGWLR